MERWQNPETVIVWTAIILILIVLLISTLAIVFYFTHRKNMRAKALDYKTKLENEIKLFEKGFSAQEAERERIAAELHDNIISKLTVIRLKSTIQYDFDEIDALLGDTIDEARRISHELSPPNFETRSLENIIEESFYRWNNHYDIKKHITISPFAFIEDDQLMKFHIIRILQELLQNIHKHSGATQLQLVFRVSPKFTSFVLSDNGKGFDADSQSNGLGLQNIDSRTKTIGAHCKFVSKKNHGTRFILALANEQN